MNYYLESSQDLLRQHKARLQEIEKVIEVMEKRLDDTCVKINEHKGMRQALERTIEFLEEDCRKLSEDSKF